MEVKIIDLKEERKKKLPFQAISTGARTEIQKNWSAGGKTLIFVNRRGLASSVICEECGFVLKCPQCDIPLAFHQSARLTCHHCDYQAAVPAVCPSCGGYKLKPLGTGTERVAQEIQKLLKAEANLLESTTPDREAFEIFQKFNSGQERIFIGTEAIFKPQLAPADLTVAVTPDATLFLPDYRSEERTFLQMRRLRDASTKKMIVQTLAPENRVYQCLTENREEEFWQEEKLWRKNYLWPPYAQLIKLSFTHRDRNIGEKETQRIKTSLESMISDLQPKNRQNSFALLGPAQAFVFREKGLYQWHILLKYKYQGTPSADDGKQGLNLLSPLPASEELALRNKILSGVTKEWKVDVDPLSIL